MVVATHNGSFHADEIFACAALSLWVEKTGKRIKIIRTRDEHLIQKADFVVDVGMKYDPATNRFDHHQKGGAGEHPNSIPYASFGLVWKHYGSLVCGSKEVAQMVEEKLVIPIDARDNGMNITKVLREDVPEYSLIKELVYAFRPDFFEFLKFAKTLLRKEIRLCCDVIAGEKWVKEQIEKQNTPEFLVLEKKVFWDKVVSRIKNIKLVICPEEDVNAWCAETTRDNLADYESYRSIFPSEWRGLRNEELMEISGVKDALFCHKAGFFAVAKSKEGAIEMAKRALQR